MSTTPISTRISAPDLQSAITLLEQALQIIDDNQGPLELAARLQELIDALTDVAN